MVWFGWGGRRGGLRTGVFFARDEFDADDWAYEQAAEPETEDYFVAVEGVGDLCVVGERGEEGVAE